MALRQIGTGTTDNNGRINITYTGKGAGKLQIIAKNGSLQSETYEVHDCSFYDKAITGNASTNWVYNTTDITPTPAPDGTTVTNGSEDTGRTYWANNPGTSTGVDTDWNGPTTVEVDIVSSDNSITFQVGNNTVGTASRTMTQLGLTSGGHLKVVYDGTTVKYYVNNNSTATYTANISFGNDNFYVRFYLPQGTNFKYREFQLYPS